MLMPFTRLITNTRTRAKSENSHIEHFITRFDVDVYGSSILLVSHTQVRNRFYCWIEMQLNVIRSSIKNTLAEIRFSIAHNRAKWTESFIIFFDGSLFSEKPRAEFGINFHIRNDFHIMLISIRRWFELENA